MNLLHVHAQLHVALLRIAREEIDVGQRVAFRHVEALEVGLLQL